MLTEDKRLQLDTIVSQMVSNQEDNNTIQFVVNDFKNKYSVEEPKETFLEKTARRLDLFFGGGKVGEAIGAKIAKVTARPEEKEFVAPPPPSGEIVGSALQSAALFTPVGTIAKGITGGVRALSLAKGASALGKIGSGLLAGEIFDVALNLQQGKTGREALTPGLATLIGGGIPAVGVAKNVLVRFGENQAPRIINSLIKPLAKDFSYGKNPGRAVAEEGIVANNFDDLVDKIRTTRQKIGQAIGNLSNKLSEQPLLPIQSALNPLDEAIKTATKQNNPTLANRVNNVKRAITNVLEPEFDEAGNLGIKSVGKRDLDNMTFGQVRNLLTEIGDMTQFTGNISDDKLVNSALKRVYGGIKDISLKYADAVNPSIGQEFRKLTEKYADLHSAEIATKYRDKIAERQNLIGMSPTIAGIGSALITAVATGGATIPTALVGLSGVVIDKLATTPAFKTRLAYMLSKKSIQETNFLFRKVPALSKFFSTKDGIFPGDIILGEKGEVVARDIAQFIEKPKIGLAIQDISQTLRGTKGMTAEDIMKTYPDIKLTRDVPATDIYGNKVKIPEGEALTPYELKGNKILLQDGETYVVSKNQFENIKGQSISKEAKPFAPELAGTEETILGEITKEQRLKQLTNLGRQATSQELAEASKIGTGQWKKPPPNTKYQNYQLPGGKNYKEILIKAPMEAKAKVPVPEGQYIVKYNPIEGDYSAIGSNGKELARSRYIDFKIKGLKEADKATHIAVKDTGGFKSSHWDEPNVISHLRMNERTYQGKKVAFMEELQSDWAREGRNKGFATEITKESAQKEGFKVYKAKSSTGEEAYFIDNKTDEFFYRKGFPNAGFDTEVQAWDSVLKKLKETSGAVPNNPLLKNWQEPTVKRALQEAVNTKADYFSWISGEQTSARYNLETQVESVEWFKPRETGKRAIKIIPKGEKGVINMDINKNGEIVASHNVGWKGKKLDEVLGKGLADKIMEKESGTLSGEGLKFGGEWANNLYDKQVADIVHNVTGAKVEKLDMGLPAGSGRTFKKWEQSNGNALHSDAIRVGKRIKDAGDGKDYVIAKVEGNKMGVVRMSDTLTTEEVGARARQGYKKIVSEKYFEKDLYYHPNLIETFDISIKKSPYQLGIRLTEEVKNKILGKSPVFKKTSGVMFRKNE